MIGGGGGDRGGEREASPPSSNSGGQFLLQLLQRNHASSSPPPPQPPPSHVTPPSVRQHPHPHQDHAVAAMGSTLPFPTTKPKNGHDLPPPSWLNNNPCLPHEFFPHPWNLAGSPPPSSQFPVNHPIFPEDFQRLGLLGNGKPSPSQHYQQQQQPRVETQFGVQKAREVVVANKSSNGVETRFDYSRNREFDRQVNSQSVHYAPHELFERSRATTGGGGGWGSRPQQQQQQKSVHHTPPGFKQKGLQRNVDNQNQVNGSSRLGLSRQLDHPGPPVGSKLHSVPALEIEESLADFHLRRIDEEDRKYKLERWDDRSMGGRHGQEDLAGKFMDAVMLRDRFEKKNGTQHYNDFREKDFRSDTVREMSASGQRMRNNRRVVGCRSDIDRMNSPFITIYESLVPAEEEKAKQKQLLTSLEKLVNREWPKAELYLYGSCANSFGVSNSDIDICLSIKDVDTSKSEILLKLAEILESDNLENVQALTRARVPIVKLLDPETGISCDICINNVLAVVNTKLLRDYAQIDDRLRQLAFIVKHWAKLRGVNVTYQGTLSSYAYVLMCIHFLQQRKPAILPCLQRMEVTYAVTVDDLECAYFDRVENLRGYGAENKESIAELVWAFFDYWAYRHDYTNAVISVRTGSIISKREKDWTRRIGNDRHLICIEDPFELSHDLGRVVDKHSIKILRQEFERAANVMQFDPDPCVTLFEPYVPS